MPITHFILLFFYKKIELLSAQYFGVKHLHTAEANIRTIFDRKKNFITIKKKFFEKNASGKYKKEV